MQYFACDLISQDNAGKMNSFVVLIMLNSMFNCSRSPLNWRDFICTFCLTKVVISFWENKNTHPWFNTRTDKFYNLFALKQPRNIAFIPSTLKGEQRWRIVNCLLYYRKIPKISPGAYIFQRFFLGGLCTEANLRFKIDWASLIFGKEFTVILCFTLCSRTISKYKPPGGGGGLIFGGAYT